METRSKLIMLLILGIIGIFICVIGLSISFFADKEIVLVDCIDEIGNKFVDEKCEQEGFVDKNLDLIENYLLVSVLFIIISMFIGLIIITMGD